MTASFEPSTEQTIDLTEEGTIAWTKFGFEGCEESALKFVQKKSASVISDIQGAADIQNTSGTLFLWSNGDDTAERSAPKDGDTFRYAGNAEGSGIMKFQVTPDTKENMTLKVYLSGHYNQDSLVTAFLGKNTLPLELPSGNFEGVYILTYEPSNTDDVLEIEYSISYGSHAISAATLSPAK